MAQINLPMALTFARMAAGPVVAGVTLWGAAQGYVDPPLGGLIFLCAGAVFTIAAVTTRIVATSEPFGAALERCANRVLVTCSFVALCGVSSVPVNLVIAAVLLLGCDAAVTGLREALSASGRRPPASALGTWTMAAEMVGVAALLLEQAAYLDNASDLIFHAIAWTARAAIWGAVALALVNSYDFAASLARKPSVEPTEIDRVH